jgi:hypothetical protein
MISRQLHATIARGEPINIHFHVFEPANLLALIDALRDWQLTRFDWSAVDFAERFPISNPNGILVVIRVAKSAADAIEASWRRFRTVFDRDHHLLPTAVRFSDFIAAHGIQTSPQ